ncbi:MAG: hypothetical protein LBV00_11950 [Propionibacteriaceae bacterium]|jgi:hypothetical protein|nr:hypothetical protein [Propionibacteriaceae bacterium]
MDVRITSTAKRHKFSATHIREAIAGSVFDHMDGDMAIYHGTDSRGIALEIGLVMDDKHPGCLTCIHVMPLEWRNRHD